MPPISDSTNTSFNAPLQPARAGDARPIGALLTRSRPRTDVPVLRYSYHTDDPRLPKLLTKAVRCPKGASKLLRAFDELVAATKAPGVPPLFGRWDRVILEHMIKKRIWMRGFDQSRQKIAEALGISKETVRDSTNRLRDAGFLNWARRSRDTPEGARQAPNLYWLQVPKRLAAKFGAAVDHVQRMLRDLFKLQPSEPAIPGVHTAAQIAADRARDRAAGIPTGSRTLAASLARLAIARFGAVPEGTVMPTPYP